MATGAVRTKLDARTMRSLKLDARKEVFDNLIDVAKKAKGALDGWDGEDSRNRVKQAINSIVDAGEKMDPRNDSWAFPRLKAEDVLGAVRDLGRAISLEERDGRTDTGPIAVAKEVRETLEGIAMAAKAIKGPPRDLPPDFVPPLSFDIPYELRSFKQGSPNRYQPDYTMAWT